jgi:type II secretory pathway pseudopilin PulG
LKSSLFIRGFSLVEVVIAVGIFAGSLVVVLSLLPSLVRQSADSADRLVAQRMIDAVHLELDRQSSAVGFDVLAGAAPVMSVPLENGRAIVATKTGLRIEPLTGSGSGGIALDEQHFLIEVWRFPQPPLSYDANAAVLPLYVRISWPYRVRDFPVPTRMADRNQFTTSVAIDR